MNGQIATESRPWYWVWAAALVTLAAVLRLHNLDLLSLTLDESTVFTFAKSVLVHGYPVVQVGTLKVQLATYELMPFIMAPFIGLFGTSDFVIRMPSLLFALGTVYLIYFAGCKWFGRRAGILAALLFATMPWTVFWGQNAFHPSTATFFGMLTLIQGVRLFSLEPAPPRTHYLAALFFSVSYLIWEGIGFLLPILFVVGLFMRWGDWAWFRNKHLWWAVAIVSTVIVVQGIRRTLLVDNYLFIGNGRGDVSLPEIVMRQPYYSPYFYSNQVFGVYPQFVVGIVFGLGLMLLQRNWHFRFLAAFVVIAILTMANLLSYYSYHYIYFTMPAFCLCVAATTTRFVDWLAEHVPEQATRRWAGPLVLATLAGIELATASAYGLKPYKVSDDAAYPKSPGTRLNIVGIDYKGLGAYFRDHYVNGEPIIGFAPYSLAQYSGHPGDMLLESWTYTRVVFDPGGDRTHYLEKYAGGSVLRSRRELQDIFVHNKRVWIVVQPYQTLRSMLDPDNMSDLLTGTKLVAQSFDGRLYLWTR